MQANEALIDTEGPRVWIVGRSSLARTGVRTILEEKGAVVLGASLTATSITEPVDVVVMLDQAAELPIDDTAILLISDGWEETPTTPVWGIVLGDASPNEIWAAILALSVGLCVFPPEWVVRNNRLPQSVDYYAIESLTEREAEVLQLLAEGLTNRQMAARLEISEHTIKFHLSSIFGKLGAGSRTEAIRIGAQHGLIVW